MHLRHTWLALVFSIMAVTVAMPAGTQPPEPAGKPFNKKRLDRLRERVLRNKVGLSDDKIDQVVALYDGQAEERQEIQKTIRQSRRAIGKLFRADSDDQAAYQQHLTTLREANDNLAGLRAKQLKELEAILTPKEQAKLLRAMEMVRRRFEHRRHRRRR